ncbi:MAG: hypothetical protein ACTSW1_00430 [Candidatus Hodarchaeales archaeon]
MREVTKKQYFLLDIDKIQPSQLFINIEKLKAVSSSFHNRLDSLAPIPIKKLDNLLVATDGHTRLFFLWQLGYKKIRVIWETDELDWQMYRKCVEWCKAEKISQIADLSTRLIDNESYQHLWIDRCQNMREELYKLNSK